MQPSDLFHVLGEIAAEHVRRRDEQDPLVIPVLLDEIESRRDLLSHAAAFLGGVFLDVTSNEYASSIEAYENPELRAALEMGLQIARPVGERRVRLRFDAGTVDADVADHNGDPQVPTAADSELLGVARALFDKNLLTAELAFLLYSEHPLDEYAQHALLATLTGLDRNPGLRFGAARTLVLFIQAQLSPGAHCQYRRGVRYSLSGDTLIRRHASTHLRDTVRKLSVARPEPLVVFLGAGFSYSSKLPVGNTLRDATIRRLTEFDAEGNEDSTTLADRLFDWAQADGRDLLAPIERAMPRQDFIDSLTLEQVVRMEKAFFTGQEVPQTLVDFAALHRRRVGNEAVTPFGSSVYELRRMAGTGRPIVITTVNFDELLEHDQDVFDVVVRDADFERVTPLLAQMREGGTYPDGKVPLLKLHGTISAPASCVADDDKTRFGVSEAKRNALVTLVTVTDDRDVPWVYVGASMRDVDFDRDVFSSAVFNAAASEYWVSPYPERTVFRFIASKRRRWAEQDLEKNLFERTVTETSDAFFSALADEWCT